MAEGVVKGELLDEQMQYWERQLERQPAMLELPADHPRPAVQSFRGSMSCVQLDQQVSGRLRQVSRKETATLFMTLMAGFKVLL